MKRLAIRIIVSTAAAVLVGVLLWRPIVVVGSRPITLEEYKQAVGPEQAEDATEKNLLVDGQPMRILVAERRFTLVQIVGGAGVSAGLVWCLFSLNNRRGRRQLQQEDGQLSSEIAVSNEVSS